MIFHETPIDGVYLIELEPRRDDRGYFARCWCADEFAEHGLNTHMPQANVIVSHKAGTLRGVHFQSAPHAEAKLVSCQRGEVFDVAVDLRPESPTYLQWYGARLSGGGCHMLYVPEDCGHGFQTLTDDTEVRYEASAAYAPRHASGVPHNDPAIGIDWPLPVTMLSDADAGWPAISAEPQLDANPGGTRS